MQRARVYKVIADGVGDAAHPPSLYELEREAFTAKPRIPGSVADSLRGELLLRDIKVSRERVLDYLRDFHANGLVECTKSGGKRSDWTLTEHGRRVLDRVVMPLLKSPGCRRLLVEAQCEELVVAFQVRLVERADERAGLADWRRYVQLDPELPAVFPALREVIEGFPRLDALANRKLAPTAIADLLDLVKERGGPLSAFIT